MKKILIFSLTYYPKFVGGAEVAIKEITDRINNNQYEFHMVTLRFDSTLPKEEKIGNVMVHRVGFTRPNVTIVDLKKFPLSLNKPLFQFSAVIHALFLHKKYRFDAVWAMMAHSTGVPAGIFKTFFPKVHYILTLQEGDPIEYIIKTMKPVAALFRRAFTKADVIQAISTFLGTWARDMGYKGRIEIIPNAVNTDYFGKDYSDGELQDLKHKLGKKSGDVFMITTSRLVAKNAVDDVIRSLQYLGGNIKFLILGIGPDEDMLKKLTNELGLESRVFFLGQIDHKEMPKYLKVSDIFIRPSLSEGMGNSFIEAMASGLPVIATQVGGISDFLFDPVKNPDKKPTGRAVSPHDSVGIADTVKLYLENKNQTSEIIHNAKEMVFQKYDWNLIAKNMEEKVFSNMSS